MGIAVRSIEGVGVRAKHLRPSESGVFQAVHAGENGPSHLASPAFEHDESSPAQETRREVCRRERMQRVATVLAREAFDAEGIVLEDAGAACNRPPQHVHDMLRRDEDRRAKTMTAGDLLCLMERSPTLRAGVFKIVMPRGRAESP